MSNAKHYEKIIRDAMARTLWLMAYADWADNEQNGGDEDEGEGDEDEDEGEEFDIARPGGGEDWDDYAPETPLAAVQAAGDLYTLIKKSLSLTEKYPLGLLFEQMASAHFGDTLIPDTDWLKQIKDASWNDRAAVVMVYADWLEHQGRVFDAKYVRALKTRDTVGFLKGHEGMAERFGGVLVHMAEGTGVDWSDDVRIKDPDQNKAFHELFDKMPRFECHYDGSDLTWSGSERDASYEKAVRKHGNQVARYQGPDEPTEGPKDLNADPVTSHGQHHIMVINPNDKSWTKHSFVLWFSAGGFAAADHLLIYANSLEDALDEGIDWVVDNRPGYLADNAVAEAYEELRAEFVATNNREPEDEEQWALMEESEQDTTSGGNAGNRIPSENWGVELEDPTEHELLVFTGLIDNPPKRKAPKPPWNPYDELATVMFRDTVTARMLRLLAVRGHMTQAEFMRIYMAKCERPPSDYAIRAAAAARRGFTLLGAPLASGPDPDAKATAAASGYNNNWWRYTFRLGRGNNYWSELLAWAQDKDPAYTRGIGWRKVIGREPIQRMRKVPGTRNYEEAGPSTRNMLRWKGPAPEDLLKHMSPAKLQWAFENLEHQMIAKPRMTDDLEVDFGWWLERIRPHLVRQNPAPSWRLKGIKNKASVPSLMNMPLRRNAAPPQAASRDRPYWIALSSRAGGFYATLEAAKKAALGPQFWGEDVVEVWFTDFDQADGVNDYMQGRAYFDYTDGKKHWSPV